MFYAMLRCLGFLWLVPGSAERHALDLIGLVLYALLFKGHFVFIRWWMGGLQSRELVAYLPLFVSPLVHLYVSPPSAWDLAVALFWTPSWGLFLVVVYTYGLLAQWTLDDFLQAVDGKMVPASLGELDETLPSWAGADSVKQT